MVWKALWNRFHRQLNKKKRGTIKREHEGIILVSTLEEERQDALIPSQYVLLSDTLDDNPVVLIGSKEEVFTGASTHTTTATSQPALISPDSTEANDGKWSTRWDNVSDDITVSNTTDSPKISATKSHNSRTSTSRDGTTSGQASLIDDSTASESTTTTTPIPQLLTFVEERPQHVHKMSSRTVNSHSSCTSSAVGSISMATSSTITHSTRPVLIMGTTSNSNPNNTSTRSCFSDTTNTTANTATNSGDTNTLVSSLYNINSPSNTQRNPKYDCHCIAEEEDDDGVEDLEILRRICCSTNPKELVHIMGEQYSCLLVDDQMKKVVHTMLQKEQQQEDRLQQNYIQNDTTTAMSPTDEPAETEELLEHLGFEAELLS